MKPLPELKASWDNATKSICLDWDGNRMGNACFIYFVPLTQKAVDKRGNVQMVVDRSVNPVTLDLRAYPAARSGNYNWSMPLFSNDLKMFYYMAYSEEYANPLNPQSIQELLSQRRELVGSAIIGQAEIEYSIKYKRADKFTQFASLTIHSDRDIEGKCLNCTYRLGDTVLTQLLPLDIHRGMVRSPIFLIPAGCNVTLTAAQENLSGVIKIRKKKFGLI